MIHPFRKLKRTIYLEGFEFILKVKKGAYKSQLNEKIHTFSRDCQYYFLIFRTLKFRNNDRCTRSHFFFFNCRVFLCTNEIANRSDGSETGGAQFTPSTPGLQELFRLFLCAVFSLNTTSCEATSLHNPSKVSTGKQNEHHAI